VKSKRVVVLAVVVGLGLAGLCLLVQRPGGAQEKKPRKEGVDPFTGKVVVVWTMRGMGGARPEYVFEKASLITVNEMPFLTGQCIEREGDVRSGLKIGLSLSDVMTFATFDTLKAYKEIEPKWNENYNLNEAVESGLPPPPAARDEN